MSSNNQNSDNSWNPHNLLVQLFSGRVGLCEKQTLNSANFDVSMFLFLMWKLIYGHDLLAWLAIERLSQI